MLAVPIGACPICAAPALWAVSSVGPGVHSFSGDSPSRVLLEPGSGQRLAALHGSTLVLASEAGRLSVVSPFMYRLHVCDPQAISSASGEYTTEVLAHSCPVDSCLATPSEMCVSSRQDVLPRPHGARVALSLDHPWTDEPVSLDAVYNDTDISDSENDGSKG